MYKEYTMDQLSLPMDLQEDIPENHLVRVINDAVNRLDMKLFTKAAGDGSFLHAAATRLLVSVLDSAAVRIGRYPFMLLEQLGEIRRAKAADYSADFVNGIIRILKQRASFANPASRHVIGNGHAGLLLEQVGDDRGEYTYLEAMGRLLAGIAPWLEPMAYPAKRRSSEAGWRNWPEKPLTRQRIRHRRTL